METKVVNKYKDKYDVYIGRGSKWGNPFVIGKDGDRTEVIEKYSQYIRKQMVSGVLTNKDFEELRGKVLGCFCKPAACHGDVLVDILEEMS